jgi:hypothetical protein
MHAWTEMLSLSLPEDIEEKSVPVVVRPEIYRTFSKRKSKVIPVTGTEGP